MNKMKLLIKEIGGGDFLFLLLLDYCIIIRL